MRHLRTRSSAVFLASALLGAACSTGELSQASGIIEEESTSSSNSLIDRIGNAVTGGESNASASSNAVESSDPAVEFYASDGVLPLVDCGPGDCGGAVAPDIAMPIEPPTRTGASISPFFETAIDNLSTFAMDVDTASFTYVASLLASGQMPDLTSVRPEEFVNFFDYDYAEPDEEWGVHIDGDVTPWNPDTHLVRVGLNTPDADAFDREDATLIFVVDISGSMSGQPIDTVKNTLALLTNQLRPTDRIGIVTYGSTARTVLEPTEIGEAADIQRAIDALETGGSTFAEAGLREGYRLAAENARPGEINTVVLASDGIANVGRTGPDEILSTIRDRVDDGINLLALGVGSGYNDQLMETLTNAGNGTSFFISGPEEAERLFVDELESTLIHVARDSKVQVEFDEANVRSWRLIGYDNRDVADNDFRNDAVDAGEVGAGHQVTAMYEVELTRGAEGRLGVVNLRWENPETGVVRELNQPVNVRAIQDTGDRDYNTAVAAVALAEVLRESPHLEGFDLRDVAELDGARGQLGEVIDDALSLGRVDNAEPQPEETFAPQPGGECFRNEQGEIYACP